ncbi:MAG TPA: tRNA (5-methylaminomethyl-2-thiouridine)(34)-methyltransferase MnmD [Bacteroidales bacterium]
MNLTIQNTVDGSKTVYSDVFQETYHSVNGAVTESIHVFIDAGFKACQKNPAQIFEVGFGTGLNAFLTLIESEKLNIKIEYQSIELFPLGSIEFEQLKYSRYLNSDEKTFKALHNAPWNKKTEITPDFQLYKIKENLLDYSFTDSYDLVYFDAFSPSRQPELWSEDVFGKLFENMNENGILTTYCAKGAVRRILEKVGFKVERLSGPPGKREMLRAIKLK